MSLYLGIMLFSLIFSGLASVPFIDLVYKYKFFPVHLPDASKIKPLGGGILIAVSIIFLYSTIFPLVTRLGVFIESNFPLKSSTNIIFLTLVIFGLIGLYFDLKNVAGKVVNRRTLLKISLSASLLIATILHFSLGLNYINIPHLFILNLGLAYIPFAAGYVLLFVKGFEKADEADGLLGGSLLITLLAFWLMSSKEVDTPVSILIAIICGTITSFLYFNIFPSRIRLGRTGSYCLGAIVGVLGLMLGKPVGLLVVGAIFGLLPLLSVFKFNLLQYLKAKGWPESKIVMRIWLFTLLSSVMGLWLS